MREHVIPALLTSGHGTVTNVGVSYYHPIRNGNQSAKSEEGTANVWNTENLVLGNYE